MMALWYPKICCVISSWLATAVALISEPCTNDPNLSRTSLHFTPNISQDFFGLGDSGEGDSSSSESEKSEELISAFEMGAFLRFLPRRVVVSSEVDGCGKVEEAVEEAADSGFFTVSVEVLGMGEMMGGGGGRWCWR